MVDWDRSFELQITTPCLTPAHDMLGSNRLESAEHVSWLGSHVAQHLPTFECCLHDKC